MSHTDFIKKYSDKQQHLKKTIYGITPYLHVQQLSR